MAASGRERKAGNRMTADRKNLGAGVLLLLSLILCFGAAARFYGLNWDQSAGQHPDERHVMMCAGRLDWPKSWSDYFNEAASPLNPRNREAHFFAYGTLPSTLLRGVMELGGIKSPGQMAITGRVLSALADTAVIALVFALAWTLYRRGTLALLAALFYALAVLPIQQAHFFVVDPFANFFVALALLFLARAGKSGNWLEYAGTGVALGLALSCKISVATFGLPVALVALLPLSGEIRNWKTGLRTAVLRTLVFSLATIVTVRLALPDAFSGFWPWELAPRWLANMREVINISTGVIDIPFTRQFFGRTPLLWPWWNMVMWGLGLGLGITAWIAWGVASWQLIRQRIWIHAVPVIWIATVFFHQGFTYQATLRYFLPIYGALCVLAAWLLVTASSGKSFPVKAWLGRAAVILVVLFTSAWAFGFLTIYSKPHTRVEASRWIYEHIEPGKTLACEHWDDFLPLPFGAARDPGRYNQIELPLYVADNMEKRGELLSKLNRADYIIIASQKLRDSIPRMPHRYPFTISYYEGLEDGSLGFDRVAEFRRDLNFFGFPVSTRTAEEAFSVYDHPPVSIYKKASRYDPELLVSRFNAIPLEGVSDTREPVKPQPSMTREGVKKKQKEPGRPESDVLLSPERWAAAQKQGTWSEMFDRHSIPVRFPLLVWVAHLLVLQVAGWALLGPLLKVLPDRGAALARPFAILIPAWFLWLLASTGLAPNDRTTYWMILGLFALSGLWASWHGRRDWKIWSQKGKGEAFRVEIVFWLAFFGFILVRAANPDLWHASWGGEKPMEMSFLYGVLRSEAFPPMNPWFAGGFINYYYFGFVLCGTLIKGLGILPEVGFNLCLATFFALACAATASAARALRPKAGWMLAWSATAFVMLVGNLFQIRFIWRQLIRLGSADHELKFPIVSDLIRVAHGVIHWLEGKRLAPYDADLYWVAARAITGEEVAPVTEFPYWSFLYGDLHPHLMALPFTLCVIILLVAWVKSSGFRIRAGLIVLTGFTLGFFWPTNTWDWPTYGALSGLVLFLACWKEESTGGLMGFAKAMAKSLGIFAIMMILGYLAFLPFHRTYVPGYGAFENWKGAKTKLLDYLFIYGFFLFILGSYVISCCMRMEIFRGFRLYVVLFQSALKQKWRLSRSRLIRLAFLRHASLLGALMTLVLVALAFLCLIRTSLTALLLSGIVFSLVLIWHRRRDPLGAIPALFSLLAFVLSLTVEYVVLVGDIGRMNTVFKFYYQVWVFFALASALALPHVLAAWRGWPTRWKTVWMSGFVLLLFAVMLYPLLATPAKIKDRFVRTPLTLDGLAFAQNGHYTWKGNSLALGPDLHAIRWLQDNIQGSPVILEMNTGNFLYTWGSRFSIHTGLPSVVGWNWHQRQQQAGIRNNRVDARIADVVKIYNTLDTGLAMQLMNKYGVRLVVVGELERVLGSPEGIAKFEAMGLSKLYDEEGVRIYEVPVNDSSGKLEKSVMVP